MFNIAVVGCGYWGPNLIRNFNSLQECKVVPLLVRIEEEIQGSKKILDRKLTQDTDVFAYPFGYYDQIIFFEISFMTIQIL